MATTTNTHDTHIDDRWDAFVTEPVPDFDGDYCYSQYSDSGHIVMHSDTPDNEFMLNQHADGSYVMMLPGGKVQEVTEGDHVQLIVKNGKIWIKGSSLVHVDGFANINVGKDAFIGVKGNLDLISDGDARITSKQNLTLQGNQVNIHSKSGMSTTASAIHFPSDVIVHGELRVQSSITSYGNLTCLQGVYSEMGFMSPGSLIIGTQAHPWPLAACLTNVVIVNCMSFDVIADTNYSVVAGAALTQESGTYMDLTSGAAMTLDAGGMVDITAAGRIGITGTFVTIEPDAAIGDVLSVIHHIHGNGNMGSPTTPPIPGT